MRLGGQHVSYFRSSAIQSFLDIVTSFGTGTFVHYLVIFTISRYAFLWRAKWREEFTKTNTQRSMAGT